MIATIRGFTRPRRATAWSTNLWDDRRSLGASTRVAASSVAGTAHTTTTNNSQGRTVKAPATATATDTAVATSAMVLSRRVHWSWLVRPLMARPTGQKIP